jgi:hypothetical protein
VTSERKPDEDHGRKDEEKKSKRKSDLTELGKERRKAYLVERDLEKRKKSGKKEEISSVFDCDYVEAEFCAGHFRP